MGTWKNWTSYRQALENDFEKRQEKNSSYSYRAYARDLGLSPSRLNGILKGKFGLSLSGANQILDKLDFPVRERWLFKAMVESEHARSAKARTAAQDYVNEYLNNPKLSYTNPERFDQLLSWATFTILEMIENPRFKNDLDWIAEKMNLKPEELKQIIKKMIKAKMIHESPEGLERIEGFTFVEGTIESKAVQDFHVNILQQAKNAICKYDTNEMSYNAWVISVDRSQIREAQIMISGFMKEFCSKFGRLGMEPGPDSLKKKDSVYCLSNYFFPLAIMDEKNK